MRATYQHMTPFLTAEEADTMLRIAEARGVFGTYADEALNEGLGEQLPQRFDAAFNYINHGIDGQGNDDELSVAAQRTNYFRETYAYGTDIQSPGIEPFFKHRELIEAAKRVTDCAVVEPAIVYANILTPGQELAIHTDVPEFRGADRKRLPQWLLVVMLHSGLFDAWRVPIATCVSWFGANPGGAFAFFPEGAQGPRDRIDATHNSAILIDTDRVFHGVERVTPIGSELPEIDKGASLNYLGDGHWRLKNAAGDELVDYNWQALRYSISWKAYCFQSEQERALWASGADDLTVEQILGTLEDECRRLGALEGERPDPTSFAQLLVGTFIGFPKAAA